jgi:hypothetical protein
VGQRFPACKAIKRERKHEEKRAQKSKSSEHKEKVMNLLFFPTPNYTGSPDPAPKAAREGKKEGSRVRCTAHCGKYDTVSLFIHCS